MKALVFGPIFIAAFGICSVQASDVPDFLKGRVFSTEVESCGDSTDGDGLQLTKEGIYGPEFSCQFVAFNTDSDPDTGRIYSVIATANCSDDTGISRADMITLSPYIEGGQVIVQSQIEYIKGEVEIMIAEKLGQAYPEQPGYNWVSDTYNLCE